MNINTLMPGSTDYPEVLNCLESKPSPLYHTGAPLNELLQRPSVAIVGSRNLTGYGELVTAQLARELAEQGVVIISGLALGVDAVAHRAALEAGGLAIAVLPSPLDAIAPTTNRGLAKQILAQGGALVSEYDSGIHPMRQYFIARNRIVSGLAQAVVITEATEKSGSIYTANFANDQGKAVFAIPGNINAKSSVGTNNLIKASKAALLTSYKDVLHALDLHDHKTTAKNVRGRNANEQQVLDLLLKGINDGDDLMEQTGLEASAFNQVLTMLEMGGKIRPLGANHWGIF